jgi:DNA (cytosine-5)-methyltransferase 1
MRVIWQSEIDPYASAVLRKHWPHVPNHGDIRGITAGTVERPDVLCGGFPCQDISSAGNKAGISGKRSGLWVEYARLISELRPAFAIMENVTDLLARGMGDVIGDLAALGYDAEWHCIPASYVGAPQPRDRVWIVAYPGGGGLEGWSQWNITRALAERRDDDDGLAVAQRRAGEATSRVRRMDDGLPNGMDRLRCLGNAIVPQIAEIIGRAIVRAS